MSKFLEFESNMVRKIAETFERTEKSMYEDVAIIQNWMQTQPHLPEILDERSILNFLFLCKCSIEKAKQRIDMYYTLRSRIPDQFENSNPKDALMQQVMNAAYLLALPKLTKEMYRVMVMKVRKAEIFQEMNPLDIHKQLVILQELRLLEDVMFGDIILVDFTDVPVNYILRTNVVVMQKVLTFYEKIYSIRLKGLYFLNAPPVVSVLLSILKKILKAKLFERVNLMKTDKITHYIPKEILPKDLGGDEPTLEEMRSLTIKMYKKYEKRFDLLDTLRVNEDLRPESCKNDDVLGFYGNFKKLDVD